ncbi:MAG TPA: HAMP domain-containing sensor histidine kinase [Polyangiaceae bacterium]
MSTKARSGKYMAVRAPIDAQAELLTLDRLASALARDERRDERGIAEAAVRSFVAFGLPCTVDLVNASGARERTGSTRDARVDARIEACVVRALESGATITDERADLDGLEWMSASPIAQGAVTIWARAWPAPPPLTLLRTVARLVEHAVAQREAIRRRESAMASTAHDLKNALAVVLASSQRIRSGATSAIDPRFGVATIERQARSMLALVGDMLDASVLDARVVPLRREPITPRALVSRAVGDVAPLAATRGIRVRCTAPATLPAVDADERRVLQVLGNLVSNALKFTPRGGAVVAGATSHRAGVAFHVRDSGPGIAACDRDAVFERFWRGPRDAPGSGLGLAIARDLVRAHGGEIWVDPSTQRGARFVFTLPAARA